MRISTIPSVIGVAMLASACTSPAENADAESAEAAAPVVVDLRVRDNPESEYTSVTQYTVPASHEIGDGSMPYEGIGWENGLVGYRLYLDGRLVSDIFGKQASDPALANIAEYGSYHSLADWGMDVLKVGPSLGLGGIGIMRGDQPEQFGTVPELSATIGESGGASGTFTITASGIDNPVGGTGGFVANYSIGSDSPTTRVLVDTIGGLPLATGIVMHEGADLLRSTDDAGRWRYIATWGDTQSENKDGLGMALFYRADQADYGGLANQTHYVSFDQPTFEYAFLAAWALDPSGVTNKAEFEELLAKELVALEGSAR